MKVSEIYKTLSMEDAKNIFLIEMRTEKFDKNRAIAAIMKYREVSQKEARIIFEFTRHSREKAKMMKKAGY